MTDNQEHKEATNTVVKKKKKETNRNYEPMTIGDWLITFLVQFIPVIGFLMLLFWAFSRRTNPSRRTWAQAVLLFLILVAAIAVIFYNALWGFLLNIFDL